jgi:hypothetical protein
MAKKRPAKFKGPTMVDKLPNNHGEWLTLVIRNTQKTIAGISGPTPQYLVDQEQRLFNELEEWKRVHTL